MIIYLSGPMTGCSNANRAAFKAAERRLKRQGYIVLNPGVHPDGLPYDSFMDIDLAMIRASDALYMLKGWRNSRGAKLEHHYAETINKNILYE